MKWKRDKDNDYVLCEWQFKGGRMNTAFKWEDCLSIVDSLAIPRLMNLWYACIK